VIKKIIILVVVFFNFFSSSIFALQSGDKIKDIQVRDPNNKPINIPFFGEKAILIFYPDPEVPEMQDPFVKAMKKSAFSEKDFFAFGIVNMNDAPFYPDFIIRFMIRREVKANNCTILTDPDNIISRKWDTGDCNDKFGILLISKDKKVIFFKKDTLNQKDIDFVINSISRIIDKN